MLWKEFLFSKQVCEKNNQFFADLVLFHVQAVVEAFSKTIYVISFFNFQICVINHIHFIIVITLWWHIY